MKEETMKQFRKKMAVIVVIALVITALIPVGAFAATTVPTIQTQPSAASAAIGSPATFTVALDESGGPAAAACTFQWQVQKAADGAWEDIDTVGSGAKTASYTTPAATEEMNGWNYRCVIINTATGQQTTSDAAALTVTGIPSEPTNQIPQVTVAAEPADAITGTGVVEGTKTALTANVVVKPGSQLSYQWKVNKNDAGAVASPVNWQDVAGATDKTLTLTAPAVDDTNDQYKCVVTNESYQGVQGESAAVTLKVTAAPAVSDVPVISANGEPKDITVLEGEGATFSVQAEVATGDALNYQWQISTDGSNYGNIAGATKATYTVDKTTTAMNDYKYKCVVTNSKDTSKTVTSAVATLTVVALSPIPVIDAQPEALTVVAGENASFTVEASVNTGDALSYQWFVQVNSSGAFASMKGATQPTLDLGAATLGLDNNSYKCEVTNSAEPSNKVTSNAVALTVWDVDNVPVIITQPVGAEIKAGENIELSVEAEIAAAGATLDYQWEKSIDGGRTFSNVSDGGVYSGATTDTLAITAAAGVETGLYQCKVTRNSGTETVTSDAARLTVVVPNVPVIRTQPVDVTAAAGETATFSVLATVEPASGLTYEWKVKKGSGGFVTIDDETDATAATYVTVPVTTDMNGWKYQCTVTNNNYATSATTFEATLTVTDAKPSIDVNPDSGLTIDKDAGYVSGFMAGTSAASALRAGDIAAMFTVPVEARNAAGETLADGDTVGTGCTVNLVAADGTIIDTLTIVIKGDVEGKGFVSIGSLVVMSNDMTGSAPLSGAYFAAGDMNGDGSITIGDIVTASNIML